MKLIGGLKTDTGYIDQQQGTWVDGRNAIISAKYGAIFNEGGFDLLLSLAGDPNGVIVLDNNQVAVFSINGVLREIHILDLNTNTTTLVTSNDIFQFHSDYPITGTYYRNNKGQIVLTWTNNYDHPRIMNIEEDYSLNMDKLTRMYLSFGTPSLDTGKVVEGGVLKSGTYFIATAYESKDKSTTSFTKLVGPFYVNTFSTAGSSNYSGTEAGVTTSKALSLSFSGIDTDYKYLIVALVSKIDGVVTAKIAKRVPISIHLLDTIITGGEDEGVLSIEELLTINESFKTAKTLTQLNNQLLMANLTKEEEIDYQHHALDIKIDYDATMVDVTSTNPASVTSPKINIKRGFMHNEVYALYVHYVRQDGYVTRGYHIPGRAVATYGGLDPEHVGKLENVLLPSTGSNQRNAQLSLGEARIFHFYETADNANADTNMGYWENQNEVYPDDPEFEDLAGEKVRHHRFPSLSYMRQFIDVPDFGVTRMPCLGIKVTNVALPAGIVGYYISAAKRDFNNSTILAQDVTLYGAERSNGNSFPQGGDIWATAGNWNIDVDGTSRDMTINSEYLRLHAFDLLFSKPSISPNYIEYELRLRKKIDEFHNFSTDTGTVIYGGLEGESGTVAISGRELNTDERKQTLIVADYTKTNDTESFTVPGNRISPISGFKYIPNNLSQQEEISNLLAEEVAIVQRDYINIVPDTLSLNTFGGGNVFPDDTYEEMYLFNLKQFKEDMYNSMFSQNLYLLSTAKHTGDSIIYSGDIIQSDYSFYTHGPNNAELANPKAGVRVARRHIVESTNFASARYITDNKSAFYPNTGLLFFLMDMDLTAPYNRFNYNSDYTAVNDLNNLEINNSIENEDINTVFPYRIIRSQINNIETSSINWRTFPVRDYYEMPKNKGEINNLEVMGYTVLIHQKYELSRTRNNVKLPTNEGEVNIGTGDIFALPPEPVLDTNNGYAGLQHAFSALLTKAGYFFVDAEQGKVFQYTGKLDEISSIGNRNFFFNNLSGVADNPFEGNGFTIGFDEEFNRVLLTKQGANPYTISYSLDINAWAFFHDYIPSYYFDTRQGFYSFKDKGLHKHNSKTVKGRFYTTTVYPTYVVPVFNPNMEGSKDDFLFSVLKWKAEVEKFNGAKQDKETLSSIFAWNSYQATAQETLVPFTTYATSLNANTRKIKGNWNFNKLRDLVINRNYLFVLSSNPISDNLNLTKPFYEKARLVDNYLLVKFQYNNPSIDGEQRNLYLYEVNVEAEPATR